MQAVDRATDSEPREKAYGHIQQGHRSWVAQALWNTAQATRVSDYGISMLHLTLLWSGPSLPLDEHAYATENEKHIVCLLILTGATAESLPRVSETQEDLAPWT